MRAVAYRQNCPLHDREWCAGCGQATHIWTQWAEAFRGPNLWRMVRINALFFLGYFAVLILVHWP